jgi:hypothetical protein
VAKTAETNVVVPIKIHRATKAISSHIWLHNLSYLLFPTTNRLAKALKSSVLKRRHPLMKNHLSLILNLSQPDLAAPSSSSFVGRCGEFVAILWVRLISLLMKGA